MSRSDAIDSLWDFGNPAASEARFRELRPGLAGQPDLLAELDTQVARALGLQGRFEEAHAALDAVAPWLGQAGDRARVRYLLERGRTLNSGSDPSRGRPEFDAAWALAIACGEEALAIDAAHMIAIVGAPEEQIAWNERALAMAEAGATEPARRWAASVLNNLGWARFEQGEVTAALAAFERALALRLERGTPGPIRIARWTVARARRELGRADEALAEQEALLAELDAAGEADGYVHQELAACLRHLGRPAEAAPHEARAASLLGGVGLN